MPAIRIPAVRLIHGKGAGVQRAIIRSLLDKHPAVVSFEDAPAEAGSWGATIVSLLVD
jgi:dsDNA-specific endonuclease/ATPase MutS2